MEKNLKKKANHVQLFDLILTLPGSGDGFVSNRTIRNATDHLTFDVVGNGRNGLIFDFKFQI